jgi:predicted metal-binding membrane protein
MALLFVDGLMNIAWVGAIALFVLLSKTAQFSGRLSRLTVVLLAVRARPVSSERLEMKLTLIIGSNDAASGQL